MIVKLDLSSRPPRRRRSNIGDEKEMTDQRMEKMVVEPRQGVWIQKNVHSHCPAAVATAATAATTAAAAAAAATAAALALATAAPAPTAAADVVHVMMSQLLQPLHVLAVPQASSLRPRTIPSPLQRWRRATASAF